MSKIKILIVSNSPFYGGGESFICETLAKLPNQYEMHYVVKNKNLHDNLSIHSGHIYNFKGKSLWNQIKEVQRIVDDIHPQITIFNGGSTIYMIPFIVRTKKILYRHTTNHCVASYKRPLYIVILHFCYCFADYIIHVSRNAFNEQKLCKKKATYIYHGIEANKFVLKNREIQNPVKFLFVGRADTSKGLDIILEAFKKLKDYDAELHIVGDGVMGDSLRKIKNHNIHYYGFKNEVATYYNMCDVFISMPKYEAFGLTLIEAMSHSVPVIASNVEAIPEVVKNNTTGFVINRSVEDLYNKLIFFIKQPMEINRMGINAYHDCLDRFTKDTTINRIIDVINILLRC